MEDYIWTVKEDLIWTVGGSMNPLPPGAREVERSMDGYEVHIYLKGKRYKLTNTQLEQYSYDDTRTI